MEKSNLQWLFSKEDYLSKSTTDSLKAIFAVIIVLVHARGMTTHFNDTIIGMILTALGYLSVAIFFFLSGYGLQFSVKNKSSYIKAFPKNKILDFYIKYIIAIIVHSAFRCFVTRKMPLKEALLSFVFAENVVTYGWYLQAMFFLYLIFWLVNRFISVKIPELKIAVITIIYAVAVIILKKEKMLFVESVLAFPLGMLWCEHKERIDKLLFSKKYPLFVLVAFGLFAGFLLLGNLNILNPVLKNISKIISAPIFVIVVLLLVKHININNKITKQLGKISLEIYIFQFLFLKFYLSPYVYIENFVLYFTASLVSTILLSLVMHRAFSYISEVLKKS